MIVSAFLAPASETSLRAVVDAARALEAADVSAAGVLDAADTGGDAGLFESTTAAARIAVETSEIGVVAANSSLYGFPYHAARRLSTVDHLSGGRSGWLMRTGTAPGETTAYDWRSAFGRGEELHRSAEYAEIARELWDSWEDGAQWPDKESGDFKDDSRIRKIGYRSTSFLVDGPLDVPPSPQRRPVIFTPVTTAQEAVYLARYSDVMIVAAPNEATAQVLAETLATAESAPLVLIAGSVDGTRPAGSGVLPAARAVSLAGTLGVAGVALYMTPEAAGAAAALVGGLATTGPRSGSGTLAARLGIESDFALGGIAQ
jgi:alkanesulfonate monooxygenase SsuD/methylene tetrahydromethanopterin reductase-like flavin-dependent oxidoreductase (luciferase family)